MTVLVLCKYSYEVSGYKIDESASYLLLPKEGWLRNGINFNSDEHPREAFLL